MRDRVFGLTARFRARRWVSRFGLVRGPEDLPQEAKVILSRPDGNRLLMLSHGSPLLSDDAALKIAIETIGGAWSSDEAQWLRDSLKPMIPVARER